VSPLSFHGASDGGADDVEGLDGQRLLLGDRIMAMFESVMGSGCYNARPKCLQGLDWSRLPRFYVRNVDS